MEALIYSSLRCIGKCGGDAGSPGVLSTEGWVQSTIIGVAEQARRSPPPFSWSPGRVWRGLGLRDGVRGRSELPG